MDKVQIITDKKGNPAFVVVPWDEYERLKGGDETAMLIAAGDAARGDEIFPAAVAARLVAGEVPLKVIREWRGLSQGELADKSGVAKQYISQIETRSNGRTLGKNAAAKLAPALQVSVEALRD